MIVGYNFSVVIEEVCARGVIPCEEGLNIVGPGLTTAYMRSGKDIKFYRGCRNAGVDPLICYPEERAQTSRKKHKVVTSTNRRAFSEGRRAPYSYGF